jgi:RNA polymerase sigma-70 factor (ECF subfamily)
MGEPGEVRTGSSLLVLLREPADPEAWKRFVQRYTPVVANWCRRWCLQSADIDEVTQEVLLKLVRGISKFPYDPAKGHFRGWLLTLTHNVWRDIRDRRKRTGWASGDPHVQHLLEEQEDRVGLSEALDQEFLVEVYEEAKARVQLRVSRATWQAFQLLALEERPGAEVAAQLGMKVAAAYAARRRVQKMLAAEVHKLGG